MRVLLFGCKEAIGRIGKKQIRSQGDTQKEEIIITIATTAVAIMAIIAIIAIIAVTVILLVFSFFSLHR